MCFSVDYFMVHLLDNLRYPKVSLIVSGSKDLKICAKTTKRSIKVEFAMRYPEKVEYLSRMKEGRGFSKADKNSWRSTPLKKIMAPQKEVFLYHHGLV